MTELKQFSFSYLSMEVLSRSGVETLFAFSAFSSPNRVIGCRYVGLPNLMVCVLTCMTQICVSWCMTISGC